MAFVMLIPSAVCSYLAYWQYQRFLWKEGLIEERNKTLQEPASDIYSLDKLEPRQKVTASGRFVHERSLFVGPRPRSVPGMGVQSGYFLITPLFDPVKKGAVLVNRGWVPASWLDDINAISKAHDALPSPDAPQPATPSEPEPAAPAAKKGWFSKGGKKEEGGSAAAPVIVQVTGVIQENENPSAVLPDNVPERLEFHWIHVPTMAETVGLPRDTPLVQIISEDPAAQQQPNQNANVLRKARMSMAAGPAQFPIPKHTHDLVHFSTMPSDHLTYALTWASLCIGLGVMAHRVIFYPPKTFKMVGANNTNQALWQRAGGIAPQPQNPPPQPK